MSGLLEEVGTPCPSRLGNSRSINTNNTFDSLWEVTLNHADETANYDFTTEIKHFTLIGVKPRRRTKTGTSFAIHDDSEGKSTEPVQERKRENTITTTIPGRKSSLLAQPAQRFRPKVSFASSPASKLSRQKEGLEHKRQSVESDAETNRSLLMRIKDGGDEGQHRDLLKRDVRRNTVFIPPEDTTVASVFMSMFSPLKSNSTGYDIQEDPEINSLEAQIARKRHAKKAMGSTRKTPLQPSVKLAQESTIKVDIAGKNTGKENIPPGTIHLGSKGKCLQVEKTGSESITNSTKGQAFEARPSAKPVVKALAARSVIQNKQRPVLGEKRNNARASVISIDSKAGGIVKNSSRLGSSTLRISRASTLSNSLKQSKSQRGAASRVSSKQAMKEYPLITDNISNPAMYEDNWLTHQEVVITQLINGLFDQMDGNMRDGDPVVLRHELLHLYQSDSFTQIYKRLQASLSYGSMSIPKDALAQSRRLRKDLGLKRKFLDVWLETYDLQALRVAVETVTGRKVVYSPVSLGGDSRRLLGETDTDNGRILKKRLERFLEVFLVQNKDMEGDAQEIDSDMAAQAYRRTILRSFMLIVLLDHARVRPGTMLPRRLFLPSSPFKSSAAVVQALARLGYKQHRLQEYEYQMDNLAVDLRDGVRLTRIVELLLYPSVAGPDEQWPLSQRLKFPCLSRAVMLSNVQIALDALASTDGAATLVRDVHAEDIVNGHREKTIALLWKLVSRWGLSELVDWDDVKKEIGRLRQKATLRVGYDATWFEGECPSESKEDGDEAILLLNQWVSILAHLNGIRFDNFGTGFLDGKIYESIVNEYEGYILDKSDQESTGSTYGKQAPLATRLRALGCSSQFANLVSPATSSKVHILDSDFRTGALAFLCSRLLSATKRARAAIVLQNAWRRTLTRREVHRRAVARHLAMQCAAVVQTQDRLLWAKTVIVQWWRTVKARRQQRDKQRFQTAKRDLQRGTGKYGRTRI